MNLSSLTVLLLFSFTLQNSNINGQIVEMTPPTDENCDYFQAQDCKEMAHKNADKLVPNDGKLDTTPIPTKGNDPPIVSSNILPASTTSRGTRPQLIVLFIHIMRGVCCF